MIVYFLDHFSAFSRPFTVIYPINTRHHSEKVLKAALVARELWLILSFHVLR